MMLMNAIGQRFARRPTPPTRRSVGDYLKVGRPNRDVYEARRESVCPVDATVHRVDRRHVQLPVDLVGDHLQRRQRVHPAQAAG